LKLLFLIPQEVKDEDGDWGRTKVVGIGLITKFLLSEKKKKKE
jgi:hypothetical protein